MKFLDMFKKKKIFVVPYVYDPGDEQVYGLFLIGRSKTDILHKIQKVAKKYDLELYILTDAIDPTPYTTREYEEGEIIRFDYNSKSDIDYCKHFVYDPETDSIEPYFIMSYLEEYIGSCGFKTNGLACLYDSYQTFFAKRNLFKEAAECRDAALKLKEAAECRDAALKLKEDATVTRDAG